MAVKTSAKAELSPLKPGTMSAVLWDALTRAKGKGMRIADVAAMPRFGEWTKRNGADAIRILRNVYGMDARLIPDGNGEAVYYNGEYAPKGTPKAAPAKGEAPAKGKAPRSPRSPRKAKESAPKVPVMAGGGEGEGEGEGEAPTGGDGLEGNG